jgi:hypothetical protein
MYVWAGFVDCGERKVCVRFGVSHGLLRGTIRRDAEDIEIEPEVEL